MGAAQSKVREVPVGGVLLPIMWGTEKSDDCCAQETANCLAFTERPDFSHPKPLSLEAWLPDDAWRNFQADVQRTARNMWRSGLENILPLISLPVYFVAVAVGGADIGKFAVAAAVACIVIGFFGFRSFTVSENSRQDKEVHAACERLSKATGLVVEYRTAYVGSCRPKDKQPCRVIAISPPAGMPPMPVATVIVGTVVEGP